MRWCLHLNFLSRNSISNADFGKWHFDLSLYDMTILKNLAIVTFLQKWSLLDLAIDIIQTSLCTIDNSSTL